MPLHSSWPHLAPRRDLSSLTRIGCLDFFPFIGYGVFFKLVSLRVLLFCRFVIGLDTPCSTCSSLSALALRLLLGHTCPESVQVIIKGVNDRADVSRQIAVCA